MVVPMENNNIHDYKFNIICWVHWKENMNYSTYIYVFAAGGLLSAPLFSWEGFFPPSQFLRGGFCPPCHFYGRAFVRLVIFTGGLLSTLSLFDGRAFLREGFCPTLRSLLLKIDFYTFSHTGFIYWQVYFIFDRKITCMVFLLLIELGITVSRSLVLKIYVNTFAHTAFIYWQIYFIFGRKISCM
jgi:hypothetical protein